MANVAVASAGQAVAFARRQASSGTSKWHNLCLSMVRQSFNLPAVEPSAKTAWENAKKKHKATSTKNIPRGVPVFYKTSTKNWHVVLSAGDGMCYSTDVGGRGKVGYISIKALASSWNITLLGWTEDLNGFTVHKPAASMPEPAKPAKPAKPQSKPKLVSKVSVGDLKKARNTDPKKGSQSLGEFADQVFTVETALAKIKWLDKDLVDGHYGTSTVTAVKGFQKKHSGATNPDGWMGLKELRRLFILSGMKVKTLP